MGRRRRLAAAVGRSQGRSSWTGRFGCSPSFWIPRAAPTPSYEPRGEVKEAGATQTASNCCGAGTHRRWLRVEIPARAWRNLGAEVSRSVTGPWRSCGAASGGPGCGGAAAAQRSGAGRVLALLKYPFYPLFNFDNGMNLISKSLTILTSGQLLVVFTFAHIFWRYFVFAGF